MYLLVISNNLERASFRQRIGIYIDILRDEGINCRIEELSKKESPRLKLMRIASDFDAVFLHKKRLNVFDAFVLKRNAKKIIYDFDDAVMYDPDKPEHNRFTHYNPFRRTVKIADLVIAGNNYLAEYAEKFNSNVRILPTGLDINSYNVKISERNDDKIRLVWIGSKSTLCYLAEIKPALEKIGNRFENVSFRIIADNFFDLQNMEVEKRNWSADSQYADLAQSDVGLAPLPDNRFTRGKCGFKILQYQAAGLPVIASPVGVNCELVENGKSGFLASTIEQWIESIQKLVENRSLREQMGQAGKNFARKFDTTIIGPQLAEMLKENLFGK